MSVEESESDKEKRPRFGNRHLNDKNDVYQHNAWDDVEWNPEQEERARKRISEQMEQVIGEERQAALKEVAATSWDAFYSAHQNKFFKDRHWLFTEFPELVPDLEEVVADVGEEGKSKKTETGNEMAEEETVTSGGRRARDHEKDGRRILEIGCGVGNTIFPILQYSKEPDLFVYGCDFSSTAINVLKENRQYDPDRCLAFVCDITQPEWNAPFTEGSLDIVVVIFVLSAIQPEKLPSIIEKIFRYLRPGGLVLFRDFGRYDMVQLRFKAGQCLQENFYAKGDGTFVYFFTKDEVRKLFSEAGFLEEQLHEDKRLQVNRGKRIEMYRVWVQAKYRKPNK